MCLCICVFVCALRIWGLLSPTSEDVRRASNVSCRESRSVSYRGEEDVSLSGLIHYLSMHISIVIVACAIRIAEGCR